MQVSSNQSPQVLIAGLLTLALSCAWAAQAPGSVNCSAKAPVSSQEAGQAIEDAQSAIAEATARRSLWTTADEALKEAQQEFAQGDYRNAACAAKVASEHAHLGITQSRYPLFQ